MSLLLALALAGQPSSVPASSSAPAAHPAFTAFHDFCLAASGDLDAFVRAGEGRGWTRLEDEAGNIFFFDQDPQGSQATQRRLTAFFTTTPRTGSTEFVAGGCNVIASPGDFQAQRADLEGWLGFAPNGDAGKTAWLTIVKDGRLEAGSLPSAMTREDFQKAVSAQRHIVLTVETGEEEGHPMDIFYHMVVFGP